MKKGSEFRPPTIASASSLSVTGEQAFPSQEFTRMMVGRVLEMLGSRRVSVNEIGPVCLGTESHITRYAPSDNQK